MPKDLKIFENGATCVRADFHLHTKADAEFVYNGDINFFAKNYLDKLEEQDIRIGAITNHNKFDEPEFKELRKNGLKRDIYLLAGVEFSVKDGSKGLHVLIIFHDDWFINSESTNYIQQLINGAFSGVANYDRPPYDANSNYDFQGLCSNLDIFKRDYFIILAHVDDSSGLFVELDGRGLHTFINNEFFTKNVLGLQKVRSQNNINKINSILTDRVPAFVEGTDCAHKGIDGLGLGHEINGIPQKVYLKIGDFNFDAVKYALRDHKNRLVNEKPTHTGPYIKSISYVSRRLGDKVLNFSPSMNNLIGIRGSGKSSILESIRYLLDIPISRNSKDFDYKNAIVQELLGSGGKMTAEIIDNRGQLYTIEKIFGETTNIYYEEELQQNLKIESLINNPLYFGQKDLSELGSEASTDDLINRLIGSKVNDTQIEIVQKSQEIEDLLRDIFKTDITLNRESDLRARKADLEIKEKAYKQNNIDKKLGRQIEFQKDESKLASLLSFEEKIIGILKELWSDNTFSTNDFLKYTSKENTILFDNAFASFTNFSNSFNKIFDIITELDEEKDKLRFIQSQFTAEFEKHKQEFSDIKRTINIQNLNPDTFIQISKQLGQIDDELEEISKLTTKRLELRTKLKKSLTDLKALWYKEYNIIKTEIDKINAYQTSVRIEVEFKGNREKLKDFLKDAIKGSGVSDKNINSIVAEYQDLIEVYNDLRIDESKIKKILSTSDFFSKFRERFRERASSFLTFRVPDKYNIYYKDRLLKEHSLGQRASAVILFILSLKENDLILIDQPEDDLDNQTIYEDVISELKRLKNKTQFIFATHNPNIPVLGDCEQIFACNFISDDSKSEIRTSIGSIDNLFIQGRIVSIMEGGKEAFNHRKMIYDNWKDRV